MLAKVKFCDRRDAVASPSARVPSSLNALAWPRIGRWHLLVHDPEKWEPVFRKIMLKQQAKATL
jgi:hypothetical protein